MIFDRVPPDRLLVDACVPLGRHLPRAATEWPTHAAEAVKRKSVGFRRLVYQPAHIGQPKLTAPGAKGYPRPTFAQIDERPNGRLLA